MARQPAAASTGRSRQKAAAAAPAVEAAIASQVPEEKQPGTKSPRRKQAVVIVHGMGEQRPLETLRAFVEAVWGAKPVPREKPSPDDIWLVPDHRVGLTELARVTTRENGDGVATDFYELYWSDLLVGNTGSQVRGWVFGLLWRWPHQVPRETFALWLILWLMTAVIVGLAMYVGLTASLQGLRDLLASTHTVQNDWTFAASCAFALVLLIYFFFRLRRNLDEWTNSASLLPGIWATETPRDASMDFALSVVLMLALPLAGGAAAYWLFPWPVLCFAKTWALIVAALVAAALKGWVIPVFGDVARYVRLSPDAVQARAQIRERGVELLRTLHGNPKSPGVRYDHGDRSRYERIVVVGHSLGSIIAYDILRLFWQEQGPTGLKPVEGPALAALREVDLFCVASLGNPQNFDLARFRELQGKASAELKKLDSWRVTDFVTLGSPLSHAEFLVSRDRAAFEERKAERLFPTCPPMLEHGKRVSSFLYPEHERKFAHHAAMFAATRWVNIHDPDLVPFLGDFISGPCRPNFGPGVMDLPVRIRRRGLFGRLVTHTDYWNVRAGGRATDKTGDKLGLVKLSAEKCAHLVLLRRALALR